MRVTPHLHASVGDSFDDFRVVVDDACVPGSASGWCAGLPAPTVSDGILTVVLDQSGIAEDFEVSPPRRLRTMHAARLLLLRWHQVSAMRERSRPVHPSGATFCRWTCSP